MDDTKSFLSNISGFIGRMSPSQVLMLLGVTVGTIVGGIVLVRFLSSPDYSVLFSNLEADGTQGIITYLDDNKIPYEVTGGGTTIMVPDDKVYKTRIALASQGLPTSGSVGFAIFDQSNIGMTDFLQQVNYKRALEGELTRTIMEIGEVKAARVHIVIPKDRLFRVDKKEPTASVLLKLGPAGLSRLQLSGIKHLISSAVEGLSPNNISIIDYNGNLLTSDQGSDPLAGLSSSQLLVRKDVESYLEHKAQSMLDDVIGPGKAVVRMTAELDFQQVERTNETYDPNLAVVRSEERTEEAKTSTDKSDSVSESKDDNKIETTVTNYEIPKTVEHIVNAVGTIQRLSIAVMLDGVKQTTKDADGAEVDTYAPRSQEEIDRLSSVVKSAVGFSGDRNDQIEVFNIAFDHTDLRKEQEELDNVIDRTFYFEIGKKVMFWAVIIIGILFLRKKARGLFESMKTLLPPPAPVVARVEATSIEDEPTVRIPEKRRPKRLDQMAETARERPEELAKVIKTLMVGS